MFYQIEFLQTGGDANMKALRLLAVAVEEDVKECRVGHAFQIITFRSATRIITFLAANKAT